MDFTKYENKLPYPPFTLRQHRTAEEKAQREAYRVESDRLFQQFKQDLLEDCGVSNNPKADHLFELVWEDMHSNGYQQVYGKFCDMVGLIEGFEELGRIKAQRDVLGELAGRLKHSECGHCGASGLAKAALVAVNAIK